MTVQKLRRLRNAEPFCQFSIRLRDGHAFRVEAKEFFLISPKGTFVVVCQADDSFLIIGTDDITALEETP